MNKLKVLSNYLLLILLIIFLAVEVDAAGVKNNSETDKKVNIDTKDGALYYQANAIFGVMPDKLYGSENDSPGEVALGKKLYFEKALSVDSSQNCNSCHKIDGNAGGADFMETSKGAKGNFGPRNSPTVLNSGYQIDQFWDGRAEDLADQATGPIMNPIEMGMPHEDIVLERLKKDENYRTEFAKVYPHSDTAITMKNLGKAIAAFERTLVTHDKFDQFMGGNLDALTMKEKEGLDLFINSGCVRCHNGPALGGIMYQKIGIYNPYHQSDSGRIAVTNNPDDLYVFKVPVLRNIALTAPYFHDGKIATLAEAVDQMGYLQLDTLLTGEDIMKILHFFTALTDNKRIHDYEANVERSSEDWKTINVDSVIAAKDAEVKYGLELLSNTKQYLGKEAGYEGPGFSGNELSCTNCHQDKGTKEYGMPWIGVTERYPRFRGRSNKTGDLKDRINGCMERSMNGEKLSEESREMNAMIAYMQALSKDAPEEIVGRLNVPFDYPNRKANFEKGERVYINKCQSCHGLDGSGYLERVTNNENETITPALWGEYSFNNGAGMHRVLTSGTFIKGNMPLGAPWKHIELSDEEAYDVAAYINSKTRPQMEGLEDDYPDLTKKPIDCPYPPYADNFSQEQHQFGPFQPIKEYYANLKKGK